MVSKIFRAGLIVNFALIVAGSVVPRVPAGTQFITGACTSDADCASGCCGFNTGKCAGAIVALQRDGGCGFGATPNDNAAQKLGFTGGITSASTGPAGNNAAAAPVTAPPAAAAPAAPAGTQFITGACTSDADCASGCCGFRTGKCAGAIIALQRDGGCGFGSGTPNDNAAKALGFTGGITSRHVDDDDEELDARAGTQFITGPCASDGDCASGCCGFNTGKCAGAIIALQRDGGCGFGATPNDNAARLLGFTGGITSPSSGPAGNNAAAPAAAAAAPASAAPGTQFITGPCASDADCASGCCGFRTGKCAGAIIALQRDGGCGFGSGTPNDNAAKALGFTGGITSRKMHRSVFAN